MTDLRTAAQQALEALEAIDEDPHGTHSFPALSNDAITALRAALAQQEQEADYPEEKLQAVAEYISDKYHVWYGVGARDVEEVLRQSARCGLVSNPPRREWRGLSEEERADILFPLTAAGDSDMECARAVEAALKERNT
jgi:hypothetical protein